MNITLQKLLLSMGLMASANLCIAHHSNVRFNLNKTLTLQGTVRTLEWTNPHAWLWIEVPDDKGGSTTWELEAPLPFHLERLGWSKQALKPGDKVTVDINPARSGETSGALMRVVLADGHVLSVYPPRGLPASAL